jgi:microcin C transport system ATP-binding protein
METLIVHQKLSRREARMRAERLFDLVELEGRMLDSWPHELSGGQRQRAMIAMAVANNPRLLIADEPTTALDVTVQAQILALLGDLKKRLNMSLLLITHDLNIVRRMADTVAIMSKGRIVENEVAATLFRMPSHPVTCKLLDSEPNGPPPPADPAPALVSARNISVTFPGSAGFFRRKKPIHALNDVSITVQAGQTTAVVGESGSGKTTLGRAILRLLTAGGDVLFDGVLLSSLKPRDLRRLRADMPIVFQDPFSSLSPRMTVGDIVAEGLKVHRKGLSRPDREALVREALLDVGLYPEMADRYPHAFSGGQRQRICLARALVLKPRLLILDEPTSALDMTVQKQIIALLRDLQEKYGIAYLFISHDLRVVRALAHHVAVMKDGKIVESGPARKIFENPQKDYTRNLMAAALAVPTAAN